MYLSYLMLHFPLLVARLTAKMMLIQVSTPIVFFSLSSYVSPASEMVISFMSGLSKALSENIKACCTSVPFLIEFKTES